MYKSKFKNLTAFIFIAFIFCASFLVWSSVVEEGAQYSPATNKITKNTQNENIKNKENFATLEINDKKYEGEVRPGMTAYDFINKFKKDGIIYFSEINYIGMGKFIDSINNIKGNKDYAWIYYINGKKAQVGVSNYKLKTGDVISFKYEKTIY